MPVPTSTRIRDQVDRWIDWQADADTLGPIRKFASKELANWWDRLDHHSEDGSFPAEYHSVLADNRFFSGSFPVEYEGQGFTLVQHAKLMREIGRVGGGALLTYVGATEKLCGATILRGGNDEQKAFYLPKYAAGELVGFFGLSDPNSGSAVAQMTMTYTVEEPPEGESEPVVVFEGTKMWISNAQKKNPEKQAGVIFARKKVDGKITDTISCFILHLDSAGVSVESVGEKTAIPGSPTGEIRLDGVRVSMRAMVGKEGQGLRLALLVLNYCRPFVAAQALILAEIAFEEALEFLFNRKSWKGEPLINESVILSRVARMKRRLFGAWKALLDVMRQLDDGVSPKQLGNDIASAKIECTEAASFVCREAVLLQGGYGVMRESTANRARRDTEVCESYEGANGMVEVMIEGMGTAFQM